MEQGLLAPLPLPCPEPSPPLPPSSSQHNAGSKGSFQGGDTQPEVWGQEKEVTRMEVLPVEVWSPGQGRGLSLTTEQPQKNELMCAV